MINSGALGTAGGGTFTADNFQFALQSALSAYSDEMYTSAKKLSGTAIVGTNAQIDPSTETFIGQTRFFKPYNTQTVNVANPDNEARGTRQAYQSDFLTYVKTVRTHGAREVNVQRVISQMDGLAKIARDFGEVRAQDEHDSIMDIARGVAAHEAANGAIAEGGAAVYRGGLQQFGHSYATGLTGNSTSGGTTSGDLIPFADRDVGYYVDFNGGGAFTGTSNGLIMAADPASTGYGAILGENLFRAVSLGMADYEPDYCYMITSPEVMTQLRVANLVDQTTVVDGNLEFSTIFSGKFRLLMSRTNQGNQAGENGVNAASTRTTFIVKPGAVEMAMLSVPMPVEMFRDANTYAGSGSTDIWYRWGYVAHPMGYDWTGSQTAFARTTSHDVNVLGNNQSGAAVSGGQYGAAGSWDRKYDMLNLGILPLFHA